MKLTHARRPRVVFTVGLPGSGKSTWAREYVARSGERVKRLNLDDLRQTLTGSAEHQRWSKESEQAALDVLLQAYRSLIIAGYNVVVDNTHVHPRIPRLVRAEFGDQVDYVVQSFLDTSLEVCLERNAARDKRVPDEVVERMARDAEKLKGKFGGWELPELEAELNRSDNIEPYVPDEDLPSAILVDIDGTLALHGDRGPYDTSRYSEDTLEHRLVTLTNRLYTHPDNPARVIVMSGRDAAFRQVTEDWLDVNGVLFDELHMRVEGDTRRDDVVKLELFNEHVRDRFNVLASFDDRDRVVHFWRRLGLFVCQVNYGNF